MKKVTVTIDDTPHIVNYDSTIAAIGIADLYNKHGKRIPLNVPIRGDLSLSTRPPQLHQLGDHPHQKPDSPQPQPTTGDRISPVDTAQCDPVESEVAEVESESEPSLEKTPSESQEVALVSLEV